MFESAENFKLSQVDNIKFDIILLDIRMGGQNGVELAKELRSYGDKTIINFITADTDYISEGYDVSALYYLIKPTKEEKIFVVLDKAYKSLTESKKS